MFMDYLQEERVFLFFTIFRNFDTVTKAIMDKKNIKTSNEAQHSFPRLKTYSVDEIIAAGGTTAFGNKLGKNAQSLIDYLKTIPKEDLLTEEEVANALKTLNESK